MSHIMVVKGRILHVITCPVGAVLMIRPQNGLEIKEIKVHSMSGVCGDLARGVKNVMKGK